jgi:hypothetical protein
MWWNPIFGSARYKWIHDRVLREMYISKSNETDAIIRKIVDTWDPLASERDLEYLFRAVQLRRSGSPIYSFELIYSCIASIKPDEKYYSAWCIIELMFHRRNESKHFCDSQPRKKAIELIRIGITVLENNMVEIRQLEEITEKVSLEIGRKEKTLFLLIKIYRLFTNN